MRCDRASELIGAYIDQELDVDVRRDVAAHVLGCPACSALVDDVRRVGGQLAAVGREQAPEHLAGDVRKALAVATADEITLPRGPSWRMPGWLQQAAVVFLACGATAIATMLLMSHMAGTAMLEREVMAAHVRSLLQESPTQIASSEAHTVKPWFAGRLDFAPSVNDLTTDGFPLAGARLDYIGDRRVAALVYRRRLHVVNVFVWPATEGTDSAPRDFVHKGYNMVTWCTGGIAYWAISDLNKGELHLLQTRLQMLAKKWYRLPGSNGGPQDPHLQRKVLAYAAAKNGRLHEQQWRWSAFRVLIVTVDAQRVDNVLNSIRDSVPEHDLHLFLVADRLSLTGANIIAHPWRDARGQTHALA